MGMSQPIANYRNDRFPPESSPALSGSITGFRSVCAMLRKCWNAGSLYAMRPSADGAENMAPTMPGAFAESHLPAVMSGTSTRLQLDQWQMLVMAGCRPRRICARRNRAGSPQIPRLPTFVDPSFEEAKPSAQTHYHRQTPLLWRSKASGHAGCRASSHKGLNNRAENSHLSFRKRERMLQGFRSIGSLQHFVSLFSAVRNLSIPDHTKPSASQIRNHRWPSGRPSAARSSETASECLNASVFQTR